MKPLYGPKVPGQDYRTAATGAALQQAMANAYRPAPNALAALAQGLTPLAAAYGHKLMGEKVKGEQIDAYEQAFQQMNGSALTGEGPTMAAADKAMFTDPRAMAEMMVNTPDMGKLMLARTMEKPQLTAVGNDLLSIDPRTNEVTVAHRAPFKPVADKKTTAMQNAEAMGLQPGSPQYNAYIESVTNKGNTTGLTELDKLIAARNRLPEGHPDRAAYQQRIDKITNPNSNGISVVTGPNGELMVQVGGTGQPGINMAPTKANTNQLQKEGLAMREQLANLDSIAADYNNEYLSTGSETRAAFLRERDRLAASGLPFSDMAALNDEQKEWLGGRTRFTQQVNQFFNDYRKLITGAAASIQEMEDLKKAIFNTDQSPTQFQESYQQFREKLARGLRLRNRLLREGYDISDSKSGGSLFDDAFQRGGDDDTVAQFVHLTEKLGLNDRDALNHMAAQGYPLDKFKD